MRIQTIIKRILEAIILCVALGLGFIFGLTLLYSDSRPGKLFFGPLFALSLLTFYLIEKLWRTSPAGDPAPRINPLKALSVSIVVALGVGCAVAAAFAVFVFIALLRSK